MIPVGNIIVDRPRPRLRPQMLRGLHWRAIEHWLSGHGSLQQPSGR